MAKPGDVLEFRSGLHGIEAPENLCIMVSRTRKKGVPWLTVITTRGRMDIKQEHATARAFRDRYDGPLGDDAEAKARLSFLISQHGQGALAEEAADDLDALEAALWEATADGVERSEEELAALHFGNPSPQQLRDVKAAVQRCRRPGTGRFETTTRGNVWRPWSREEVDAMRAAWTDLEALRQRIIDIEETDEGRAYVRIDVRGADLEPQHRATLAWVQAAMVQWIDHDGVPDRGVAGIGGTGAVAAFGMDLHRALGFLAQDWIRSGHTTRSSDYVHFLIESGLWSPDDAVAGLMRRHVNQEAFFEHVPDEAAAEAAAQLDEPAPEDGRDDLRHLTCHTIDPPDAKDFDDAVGLEELADGRQRLWVHIADVSHYVRPGTLLDKHAKDRATSVYLPGRVLPMLPARIADHLCSLRDDGDRYALSVGMTLETGRIVDAAFHASLIRVDENLSYADALSRRDAGDATMTALFDVATQMQQHRRGLALETGEVRVEVGDAFTTDIKHGNDATRMIETFMVAANETVASHLHGADVPLLFRCHPLPDAAKAERFEHQMDTMGLAVPMDLPKRSETGGASLLDALKAGGKIDLSAPVEAEPEPDTGFAALDDAAQEAWLAPFRGAVDAIATLGSARAEVATMKLLACMGRAHYAPENEGHFGLASTHYCHFTSPIRRYPDLVVHRNLKWLIQGSDGPMPHKAEDLQRMCDHCSDQERAAAGLERRIKNACLVLASMHGDAAFSTTEARAAGMVPGRLYLALPGGLDASAGARDWPGGPYHVDDWESMLFVPEMEGSGAGGLMEWYDPELGETRWVRIRLGDRLTVRLTGRDVAAGKTSADIVEWA